MGGHGGLNILPQKKWNVYNWDNREIVERDKRQHAQKQRRQYEQQRDQALSNKMDVLRQQRGLPQYKQQEVKPRDSLVSQEMRKIADGSKHVNLFEEQERILLNKQAQEKKRLREDQFLKDKNMDYSTRFLGIYGQKTRRPWYLGKKGEEKQRPRAKGYKQLDEVIYGSKTESRITKEVIEAEKREGQRMRTEQKRDRTRQRVFRKYEQFEDKCARVEGRESKPLKEIIRHQEELMVKEIQQDKQAEIQKMREKRLKREEKQRKRAEELKRKREEHQQKRKKEQN